MPLTPLDLPKIIAAGLNVVEAVDLAWDGSPIPEAAADLIRSVKWCRNPESLGGKSITKKELRIIIRRSCDVACFALDSAHSPATLDVVAACAALVAVVVVALAD